MFENKKGDSTSFLYLMTRMMLDSLRKISWFSVIPILSTESFVMEKVGVPQKELRYRDSYGSLAPIEARQSLHVTAIGVDGVSKTDFIKQRYRAILPPEEASSAAGNFHAIIGACKIELISNKKT
jgi:hypothetical protein